MHKGRRIKMTVESGKDKIIIPFIEESSFGWRKYSKYKDEELNGRPTKVLKRLVDTGVKRDWWSPESLRKSTAFRDLVILCYGKTFWESLEKLQVEGKKRGIQK